MSNDLLGLLILVIFFLCLFGILFAWKKYKELILYDDTSLEDSKNE